MKKGQMRKWMMLIKMKKVKIRLRCKSLMVLAGKIK
jgi:hypothetical protein